MHFHPFAVEPGAGIASRFVPRGSQLRLPAQVHTDAATQRHTYIFLNL